MTDKIACYGVMCPKHQNCQRYEDAETSQEIQWQATCDHGDCKFPGFTPIITPPPMTNKFAGTYEPNIDVNQRNDGHKGIKSRGTLC